MWKNFVDNLKKNASRDVPFLLNAVAFSLIFMALMFAIQPYVAHDPQSAEVEQSDKTLVTVHPGELVKLVKADSGKPVLLMMYASWCGYCKQLMPVIVDLKRSGALEPVETVFLSIDDQPRLLSRYLVHRGYAGAFTPYRLEQDLLHGSMDQFIEATGSHFRGTIPYVGFFNRDGKLVTDAAGVVDKDSLMKVVSHANEF